MRKQAKIVFVHVVGWILILIGLSAFFVPFVPGFVLVILGIYIISLKSVWVKSKLDNFFLKHPHLKDIDDQAKKWWHSLWGRIKIFFRKKI